MAFALQRRERSDTIEPYTTGQFSRPQLSAQPGSIIAPGQIVFDSVPISYSVRIYEIAERVVPNWFVVGIPARMTTGSSVNIFFHPQPGQAGYNDGAYFTKTQKWRELIRYGHYFAGQTAVAKRDVITIIPILTQGSTSTCGIFPAHWLQIVSDIVADVANDEGLVTMSDGAFASLTISSFSAGIEYSDVFRKKAAGLAGRMTGIVDFDATFSRDYRHKSQVLTGRPGVTVLRYDQEGGPQRPVTLLPYTKVFHVPIERWRNHSPRPTSPLQELHGLIPMRMWRHACGELNIG
ncbi:MAG TPA: hypothetical protein VD970_15065 [Acetobacteraceae bacterium]|nr:hypothetical protein [Acetobacteraceae bacterium]